MKSALIVPDSVHLVGNDQNYPNLWYHGVKNVLRRRDFDAHIVAAPDVNHATATAWSKDFATHYDRLLSDEYCYLFAQGLGALSVLRFLEGTKHRMRGTHFVAVPAGRDQLSAYPKLSSYLKREGPSPWEDWDWSSIRAAAGEAHVYHGTDDPQVPVAHGRVLAEALGVQLTLIPGVGHIDTERSRPELFRAMREAEPFVSSAVDTKA